MSSGFLSGAVAFLLTLMVLSYLVGSTREPCTYPGVQDQVMLPGMKHRM